MREIVNQFSVPFEYRVLFVDEALATGRTALADLLTPSVASQPARAVVFVDQTLARRQRALIERINNYFQHFQSRIELAAPVQVVVGGEVCKQGLETFERCVKTLAAAGLDRHSYVVTFGGGAVLDCVGFAASCVHRGLRQIRFPSTVLGQNDAGIGVKNGVDYAGQKNFLGAFAPPFAVVNDFSLLATLPASGWRDGLAEAVKVALIRDEDFFNWIESNRVALVRRDRAAAQWMIHRCAELHLRQITQGGDPFEFGSARPLDFGHWAGHKLEQLSGFRISHGHAVAAGVAIDTLYSARIGLLTSSDAERVMALLRELDFDLQIGADAGLSSPTDMDNLLGGMQEFQQHLGGALALTMLAGIGSGVEVDSVDMEVMRGCCTHVVLGESEQRHTSTRQRASGCAGHA